ncbi:MAG TPA: FtsX-like permease family protein [Candidatus Saccharimonadales bacterium]
MNVITRGMRNAFRNGVRTISIVVILGLSIGLSLTMLVAHQAVGQKIASVKSSIGNTISVSPAGVNGFEGGGNPLTTSQINEVKALAHVSSVTSEVTDRLTTSNTNLTSAIDAGSLGKRFNSENGSSSSSSSSFSFAGGSDGSTMSFTPPISAVGTTDPTTYESTTVKITSGTTLDGSTDKDVALVGSSLASKNNLKVGSTFTAYNTTITVQGIFDTGTSFANNTVIFSLPTLQRLSSQTNDVTSATVTVDTLANVSGVVKAIQNKLGSSTVDVTSSESSATTALAPLQSVQSVSLYSLVGAVIAGGVIILLTMIMIVRERKREIGVVKAIGASNVRIMSEFMVESLTLTILGAIIGLFIGVVGGQPVTKMLVNNSSSSTTSTTTAGPGQFAGVTSTTTTRGGGFARGLRNNGAVKGLDNIKADIGWGILLDGFGAAVLIAVLGSTLAAGMISKVRPSEVMRVE